MLTKPEFLAALKRETRILTHLASRLTPKHLGFRFTPPQRSTLELLQYLTINAQASITFNLSGNWDHWDALEAGAKSVDLAGFPPALKVQERAIARLLAAVSDRVWRTPRKGKRPALGSVLFEDTLSKCIGYRMQLFLQAKAAGLAELKSSDLWAGKP